MREFEKFGKLSKIVKDMVNKDDIKHVNKFYNYLNNYTRDKVFVTYEEDFWQAYEKTKNSKVVTVICTRLKLYNKTTKKKEYHAVALLKQNKMFYMFDPNGIVYLTDNLVYLNKEETKKYDSQLFETEYKITLPQKEGMQYLGIGWEEKKGYINGAGYCMFYIFISLTKILDVYSKSKVNIVSLCKKYTDSPEDKLKKYFPMDIHDSSVKVMFEIFGS